MPKILLVDFSQARYGYVYLNGKPTNNIENAKLISIDKFEADKLESVGLEIQDYMHLELNNSL